MAQGSPFGLYQTFLAVEGTIGSAIKWSCKQRSMWCGHGLHCGDRGPTVGSRAHGTTLYAACSHELFGFDIMLESDLKAYLIEVNISPSMASSSPLDRDIKGAIQCGTRVALTAS